MGFAVQSPWRFQTIRNRRDFPSRPRDGTADVKPVVAVDRRKERVRTVRTLRAADQEQAAGPQRKVENIEDPLLRFAVEIDEQVAAAHQIHP